MKRCPCCGETETLDALHEAAIIRSGVITITGSAGGSADPALTIPPFPTHVTCAWCGVLYVQDIERFRGRYREVAFEIQKRAVEAKLAARGTK